MNPEAYEVIRRIHAQMVKPPDGVLRVEDIAFVTAQLETLLVIYAPEEDPPEPRRSGVMDAVRKVLP